MRVLFLFVHASLKSFAMEPTISTELQCDKKREFGFDLRVWAPNADSITVMVASAEIEILLEDEFLPMANLSKNSVNDEMWEISICLPIDGAFYYSIANNGSTYKRIDPYCRQMNGSPPLFRSCEIVPIQV